MSVQESCKDSVQCHNTPSQTAPAAHASAVVGLQWGDEGKGKIVDLLAQDHDAVVRYNGGANAGHSVVVNKKRYALHLVPSGILYPGKHAIVANGVVIDPAKIIQEIDQLEEAGIDTSGLVLSSRAHVVLPYHKLEDQARETLLAGKTTEQGDASIGTTKRGIGPCYAEKIQRAAAVRMGDLLRPEVLKERVARACTLHRTELGSDLDDKAIVADALAQGEKLSARIQDTTYLLHDLVASGKKLLFEGANATMLDVDHGTYPYVTSSSTTALGIGPGTGIPTRHISRTVGVIKAYSTRVGHGPMLTELDNEIGEQIRTIGNEFGTTTGRPRRVGWLDLVAVKYAAMISGVSELALTLLDVLAGFDELLVCTGYRYQGNVIDRFLPDASDLAEAEPIYETLPGFSQDITACRQMNELPAEALRYIERVESFVGVRVGLIGVGPGREQTIRRDAQAGSTL